MTEANKACVVEHSYSQKVDGENQRWGYAQNRASLAWGVVTAVLKRGETELNQINTSSEAKLNGHDLLPGVWAGVCTKVTSARCRLSIQEIRSG